MAAARRARAATALAAVLLVLGALAGCGGGRGGSTATSGINPFVAADAPAPATTAADSGGGEVSAPGGPVAPLAEGDCFNVPVFTAGVSIDPHAVTPTPCGAPHQHEVYALLTHPAAAGSAWPGDAALDSWGDDHCLALFGPFVGLPYEQSSLDFAIVRPDRETWDEGDRAVACTLHASTFALLTGSMKGTAR